jgi:hypothetical protein
MDNHNTKLNKIIIYQHIFVHPSLTPSRMAQDICHKWTNSWAASMPDQIVAEQVADPDGVVGSDCLDDDRLERMVEDDQLPEEFHPDNEE